ncbi:endo-1,4-beta-xylanase [uncultured Friedmanniella sp.]|uniref:endo-1,4-beta-xylanase n=1 Tax=uncultured Friedmanniella sp. TaxID=335381 RepID=UPI0035CB57FE
MTTKSIGISADADEAGAAAGTGQHPSSREVSRRLLLGGAAAATVAGVGAAALPAAATSTTPAHRHPRPRHAPLWRVAAERGITFGSSTATWQVSDAEYAALFDREAGILFTEDDLLWYQLKPTPDAPLNFSLADTLFARARQQHQLMFAAHLVWDEGFGDGWPEDYLWELDKPDAEELLYGTAKAMVRRYRGRTAGWIVANEVTSPIGDDADELGFRTNVPWYATIGQEYVGRMFRLARRYDPHATLVLNEFGFETTNEYGDDPAARQEGILSVIDTLQRQHVPLDAVGVQAHLVASYWDSFDPKQYRRFLRQIAKRGLKILVTELDVLDDGLPADVRARDAAVGDIYADYLRVTLAEPAVKSVMAFGLSDRYTWLQEDFPREDGAARRPLAFDEDLHAKPAYRALRHALAHAPHRKPLWHAPRERRR